MVGGRTNHWGRISLRFGPHDFKGKTRDGLGDDWPISYNDIKPYYDEVDDLIGIFGSNEGLENHPDGHFHTPPAPRCWERVVKRAADKHSVTCIPSRLSIITSPHNGRPAASCSADNDHDAHGRQLLVGLKPGRLCVRVSTDMWAVLHSAAVISTDRLTTVCPDQDF